MTSLQLALIVEHNDDEAVRLVTILQSAGFEPITAFSAREALELASHAEPAFVVVGSLGEGMDSIQLIEELRRVSKSYLLVIGDSSDEIDVVASLNAGADAYVPGPVDGHLLRARMRALKRRPALEPQRQRASVIPLAEPTPVPEEIPEPVAIPEPVYAAPPPVAPVAPPEPTVYEYEYVPAVPQYEPEPEPVEAEQWTPLYAEPPVEEPAAEVWTAPVEAEQWTPLYAEPPVEEPAAEPVESEPWIPLYAEPPVEEPVTAPIDELVAEPEEGPVAVQEPVAEPTEAPVQVEEQVDVPAEDQLESASEGSWFDRLRSRRANRESDSSAPTPEPSAPAPEMAAEAVAADPSEAPEPVADPIVEVEPPGDSTADDNSAWMEWRGLAADRNSLAARVYDQTIELAVEEHQILVAILAGARKIHSRASLARMLMQTDTPTDAQRRAVDEVVTSLYRKIDDSPMRPRWIETVPGIGYRRSGG